ncbi:MAG TPA: hypothetical protein VE991_10340 [Acidimicrobiales bacterium]|nr:hypothetical protein [Acidimicrobiales bacterium]
MAEDRMTRFDADLYEAAVAEGRREQRSARQQLEHWTRLGRQLSAYETASRRRITAAVQGDLPLANLSAEERVVANIELDVAIRERAAGASFGRAVLDTGATAVALDEHGALVAYHPDGTTSPLQAVGARPRGRKRTGSTARRASPGPA